VDEIQQVWLAQLVWEKEEQARHTQALANIDDKQQRKVDEYKLLCLDSAIALGARVSPSYCSDKKNELRNRVEELDTEREELKVDIQESERTIAELEGKLGLMTFSNVTDKF
jgi:hypothetical protein